MALLELERMGKRYKRGSRVALDDVVDGDPRGRNGRRMGRAPIRPLDAAADRRRDRNAGHRHGALRGRPTSPPGIERSSGRASATADASSLASRGPTVLDQLIAGQLGRRVRAVRRACSCLEGVGARTGRLVCGACGRA